MKIEWIKNKNKEKIYPVTHADAVITGNGSETINETVTQIKEDLSNKADKATTLSGYGITDAATSTQGGKADTAVQSVKIGDTEYKSGTTVTLPSYPTSLPASDVKAWAKADSKPTYTASEVGALASTVTHLSGDIATSQKGAANGLATLDANGLVPSSQLPSYVDDVLEYTNKASFPTTGLTGKIYVDTSTNLTYRWSGSAYVEISPSLALGETSSTAYAGDKGKAVADNLSSHTSNTSNPHSVTKAQVGLSDVDNKSSETIRSEITSKNVTDALGYTPTQQKDIDNAIDNIQIGGRNLIIGSGSIGTDYHEGTGQVIDSGYNGQKAVRTSGAWSGFYIRMKDILDRNNIQNGDTVTISMYVSTDSESEVISTISLFRFTVGHVKNFVLTLKKGVWTRISATCVIPDITTVDNTMRFESYTSTDYGILWSCPKVEKGNKVTDWTPAPEDGDPFVVDEIDRKLDELKVLGWTVPSKCPIQNYTDNNGLFHQRVGRVDLGSLDWFIDGQYFKAELDTISSKVFHYIAVFSNRYEGVSIEGSDKEKTIFLHYSGIMIRDSSYYDVNVFKQSLNGEYAYYELAEEKTFNVDGYESIYQISKNIGKCKNLFKPNFNTLTWNGITCTNNGDGTFTVNGTANGNATFTIYEGDLLPTNGNKIVGCPKGGSTNSYCMTILNSSNFDWAADTGDGVITEKPGINMLRIDVYNGTTIDNLVFKPMICSNLNATYDDFVPYTGDGETLTADVAEINRNLDYNANKNLAPKYDEIVNASARYSDKIYVYPSTDYMISFDIERVSGVVITNPHIYPFRVISEYDANDNLINTYINEEVQYLDSGNTIRQSYNYTTGSNTSYLIINFDNWNSDGNFNTRKFNLQVEVGNTLSNYIPYRGRSNNLLSKEVDNVKKDLTDLENADSPYYLYDNLFCGYWDGNDGTKHIQEWGNGYASNEFIKVEPLSKIRIKYDGSCNGIGVIFFNNNTFISSVESKQGANIFECRVPNNANQFTFNFNFNGIQSNIYVGYNRSLEIANIKNDLTGVKEKYSDTTINVGRKADTTVGDYSTAEGYNTEASGYCSYSEGYNTTASGNYSHAEGGETTASGNYSHAEGVSTRATGGFGSHAEGCHAEAIKAASHAEGNCTIASGDSSHAEGYYAEASGDYSHAEGGNTTASNSCSHAGGHYNAVMTTGGDYYNTTGTAFVIGNGTSSFSKSNAFSVQFNGTVKAKSTITASTTADYAEFFEWLDENPNDEDRVGHFVTLEGNKIKIATDKDDYILGVVSGEPFVLGNGDCDTWNGMYLHDEFRRTMYEPAPKMKEIFDTDGNPTGEFKEALDEDGNVIYEGERFVINPKYDSSKPYISRFDRAEWSPVGMLGVLPIRHDGTAKVNGYVTVNKDGIATACDKNTNNSYRVIHSNSEDVVEIIFR